MSVERRRPRSLSFLALLLVAAGLYQLLGVFAALARWEIMASLMLSVPAVYVPLRNGLLAASFLGMAAGFWRQRRWAARLAAVAFPVIAIWGLIERVWLARSDFSDVSLPWTILVSILWPVLSGALIWRARWSLR